MNDFNHITTKVNKKLSLSVIALSSEIDLKTNIWAINWFNTNKKWLYNLYTFLAIPMAMKIGVKLIYKGSFVEKLEGKDDLGRKMLLIVEYPSVDDFFSLVHTKYFQIISLLRMKAVKRFNFGFSKRRTSKVSLIKPLAKGASCIVHHFKGSIDDMGIKSLEFFALQTNIRLIYFGEKVATLNRVIKGKPLVEVRLAMDGIIVFEGEKEDLFQFYKSEKYSLQREALEDNYLAIFRKTA